MKILYSCLSRSWGGMEMFTLTAVEKLLERGIETHLLCYPGSKLEQEASASGLSLYTCKASSYLHPVETVKLSSLIQREGYHIIHTQASKDLWVLVPALKIRSSSIPLILTKQVGSFIIKKDAFHKFIYNRLDLALAISEVIKKNLLDTCPLPEEKVKILHNGVDTTKFDPEKSDRKRVRDEFEIIDSELVIGMLARFSWGKGHEEFLYAASELLKEFNNLKFMIVGEPSYKEEAYAEKIYDLCREFEIENKVIFTGFRKDTKDILAAMDIFAFPSHSEAFGIALVEAMALGKPTVCSNSDGILDIAVDGVTSYLFEKQNGDDLALKLRELINSHKLRNSFGIAARKRAVEFFDLEFLTTGVINIYQDMLNRQ
jgi:glycosyltransferase involved in cell wall biosynthesis